MPFNPFLGPILGNIASNTKPTRNPGKVYARVLDVILDSTHPDYKIFGQVDSINGIRYKLLETESTESDPRLYPFAFSLETSFKSVPLIDEIVEIVSGPSNMMDVSPTRTVSYYKRSVNIFNNPTHNAFPEVVAVGTEARLGENVIEKTEVRSLQSFPGDVYLEGRLGQSLRFSGFKSPLSPFTDDSNNGDPYIILRNGQKEIPDIEKTAVEDINEDDSSIYLTSNHVVGLSPISTKYDTYTQGDVPITASSYKGRQILIDSGRIFLNGKDDSILLSSKTSIGLSSNSINIDGSKYIQLDAKKVYLGVRASNEREPVVKGKSHESWALDLLTLLKGIKDTFAKMTPAPPTISALLVAEAGIMTGQIQALETKLKTIISEKVWTE